MPQLANALCDGRPLFDGEVVLGRGVLSARERLGGRGVCGRAGVLLFCQSVLSLLYQAVTEWKCMLCWTLDGRTSMANGAMGGRNKRHAS